MYNQGKIMRRLLGRPQNESSSTDGALGPTSFPGHGPLRPNASQNALYQNNKPITCLDRSNDGRFAVLGGRDTFKTVQFDGLSIREGIDIRALIQAYHANRANVSTSMSEQLSIKDVEVSSNLDGEPTIFTACANGKIFQYNMARLGTTGPGGSLDVIQMGEDSRQVNKLAVNPHRNTFLLAGSQDGVVRCFDVKTPCTNRNGQITFRAIQAFKGNSEGIRDIKWSPKDGYVYACATDSGAILKWDIRKAGAPLMRINAHNPQKGTSSISWHPDGDHLISGGFDRKCHVWDLSKTADKKQKPKWTISAPAPVTDITWRPAMWSATAQGRRAAQVAVSYDNGGPGNKYGISSVHIWDLGRPTMPFKEIDMFETSPCALLWHAQDLLWTAGPDGVFAQCDIAFAPKVIDRQPFSNLDFSPRGDVLMMLEERPHPPKPRPIVMATDVAPPPSLSSSPNGQMLSVSRSDSEDDAVGTFLGPRKRAGRKRRPSLRSNPAYSASTTPPGPRIEEPIVSLEQAIDLTGTFRPQQVMAIGHVPTSSKSNVYQYLSSIYLEVLEKELPYTEGGKSMNDRVASIMEQYAQAADTLSQFRLAQTWRILSYAVKLLLTRRAQYHLEVRTARRKSLKSGGLKERSESKTNLTKTEVPHLRLNGESPKRPNSISSLDSRQTLKRSLLSSEVDSESNVPTPLARPLLEEEVVPQHPDSKDEPSPPDVPEGFFSLPPALDDEPPHRPGLRKRLDSAPLSFISHDSQVSSTEGYDFYDLGAVEAALPKAIDMPKKKEPLSLEYVGPQTPNSRQPTMNRHDSDQSFARVFSVSDTSHGRNGFSESYSTEANTDAGPKGGSDKPRTNSTSEEVYESRIRGKEIHGSLENNKPPLPRSVVKRDSSSLDEMFMISQTTAASFESEQSPESSQEPSQEPLHQTPQEATTKAARKLDIARDTSPRQTSNERIAMGRPEEQTSTTITETDFMPWPEDPPFPFPLLSEADGKGSAVLPPLDPYKLLARALEFETKHSALNASAMILLLKPLVPDEVVDQHQAAAVLRQYHQRLMSQQLFIEATLLRNLCVRDWPAGLDVWGDNYTPIYSQAQQRVSAGFVCSQCHKPREIDRSDPSGHWKCERCRAVMAPCAICKHRDGTSSASTPIPVAEALAQFASSAEGDVVLVSTWWYCPGCAHGGHATCIQGWHAPISSSPPRSHSGTSTPGESGGLQDMVLPETYSDGCCPLDGCGHACLPGKWRNESSIAKSEEVSRTVREQTRGTLKTSGTGTEPCSRRASGSLTVPDPYANSGSAPSVVGGVRSDALEVSQSRAVEGVREALALAGIGAYEHGGGGGGGGLSSHHYNHRPYRPGFLSALSSSPGRSTATTNHNSFPPTAEGSLRTATSTSTINTGNATANSNGGGGGGVERERRKSVKFTGVGQERASR